MLNQVIDSTHELVWAHQTTVIGFISESHRAECTALVASSGVGSPQLPARPAPMTRCNRVTGPNRIRPACDIVEE